MSKHKLSTGTSPFRQILDISKLPTFVECAIIRGTISPKNKSSETAADPKTLTNQNKNKNKNINKIN